MFVDLGPLVREGWVVDQFTHIAGYRCFSHRRFLLSIGRGWLWGIKCLDYYSMKRASTPARLLGHHDNGKGSSDDANRRNGTPFLRSFSIWNRFSRFFFLIPCNLPKSRFLN